MSMTSRLVSRLTAISVKTGSLPLLSWSLSPSSKQAESPREISYLEACSSAGEEDLRGFLGSEVAKGKKVVFLGEQHEQPGCLKAGLVILDELVKVSQKRGQGRRDVVLVLEHFNILQQGILDAFAASTSTPQATESQASTVQGESVFSPEEADHAAAQNLLSAYTRDGTEGFSLPHYLPLLLHARYLNVKIVGGFPPRHWARVIAKEGVEALREKESEHFEVVGFERWQDLEGSGEHRAIVRSMVRGEPPFLDPPVDLGSDVWKKGLYAAQAFKDAMLSYVVDRELAAREGEAMVFVLTGSGHCEYGLGAPERLKEVERGEVCVVVCKGKEGSGIWRGEEWGNEEVGAASGGNRCADAVVFYDDI